VLLAGKRQRRWALQVGLPLLGIGAFVAIWASTYRLSPYLISPAEAFARVGDLLTSGETWPHVGASFARMGISLLLTFVIGILVAFLMQTSAWLRDAFSLYVYGALSLPALPVALFCLIVFGTQSQLGVIVGVIVIAFPFVVISLLDGLKALDAGLGDVATIYRLGRWQRIRHVVLPELSSYMFAALRNVYALGWKLVVFMEIFSQRVGIGSQYGRAYEFFIFEDLVAWLGVLLVGMFAIEYLALRPLEAYVLRWRN
jgi:NitT/TauT family transport system permease protein